MAKEDKVVKYIRDTKSQDVFGNHNQYNFELAANTKILLDVSCYERLLQITNISAFNKDEHNTFLFGLEIKPNQIYFSIPDKSRDYKPLTDSVISGEDQMKEVVEMIKNHPYTNPLIVCHIHTHPYGVLKDKDKNVSLQHNFVSGKDIETGRNFRKDVKKVASKYGKNADTIEGLIAIDNAFGNSMISFVWYSEEKCYRFDNVKVVEKQANGQLVVVKDLHKDGFDYIEQNFGLQE